MIFTVEDTFLMIPEFWAATAPIYDTNTLLAERIGTATNYISAIESGRRFPSVEMLEKIACALELDSPELFSMKSMQSDVIKNELEERIWQDIGKNISNYISKNMAALKKRKPTRNF